MDYLADKIDKLATGEGSPINLSSEEVGEGSIAPTHNAEEESLIATGEESLIGTGDPNTTEDESITTEADEEITVTEDESPIDLSSEEVGESSIALDPTPTGKESITTETDEETTATEDENPIKTGEETSNDNVTKDDNDEPETAPEPKKLEPLLEITPPETTSEPIKTTHQDESPLKPPQPLEPAKIEESSALKPLLQKELVTRLGVSTSAISHQRKKGDDEFKEWSKRKDPDGLAWEYNSETKKFSPVAETPS